MKLKIKKVHPNAQVPKYESAGAACFDLTAVEKTFEAHKMGPMFIYDTGLAFEIPKGYVGLIFPRSSITTKTTLSLGNCVGVIDSDYRGTVKFHFRRTNLAFHQDYKVGERIGQMMILPVDQVQFEVVEELSDTVRGTGGFGSTGN